MAIAEYADYDGLGHTELVRNKNVKPSELVEEVIGHTPPQSAARCAT